MPDTSPLTPGTDQNAGSTPPRAMSINRQRPGMMPALVVVAIALLLIVGFGVLGSLSSPSPDQRDLQPGQEARVKGSSLLAISALHALQPIRKAGTPPDNIVDSVTLPKGVRVLGVGHGTTTNQYERSMRFSIPTSEGAIIEFYRTELSSYGWKLSSLGAALGHAGSTEVLAQKDGSDGWTWEVGAVISPTRFTGPSGTQESTRFTLVLIQEPDAD